MRISELQRQQTQINGAIASLLSAASKARRASSSRWCRCSASTTSNARPTAICRRKKQTALLDEELQRKQGGEQFAVLVPANLPDRAVQAEAAARDVDGARGRPRPRRRRRRRP